MTRRRRRRRRRARSRSGKRSKNLSPEVTFHFYRVLCIVLLFYCFIVELFFFFRGKSKTLSPEVTFHVYRVLCLILCIVCGLLFHCGIFYFSFVGIQRVHLKLQHHKHTQRSTRGRAIWYHRMCSLTIKCVLLPHTEKHTWTCDLVCLRQQSDDKAVCVLLP